MHDRVRADEEHKPLLEELRGATRSIRAALEAVLDERPFDPEDPEDALRLNAAYHLAPELLQTLTLRRPEDSAGVIAARGRAGLAEIFATVRRTGWSAERCRDFVARGMLAGVMVSMSVPEHRGESADLDVLSECTFVGEALRQAVG
jgi:hypothetical protein